MANPFSPNGIQGILFDLDGTLHYNRPSSTQVFIDLAIQLGAGDSPEKRLNLARWTHYYWAQSPELLQDMQTFGELQDPFWLHYAHRSLLIFDCTQEMADQLAPKIHSSMQSNIQIEDWVPPDVPHTLQELKNAGFQLGVLSNRSTSCNEHLESLGLDKYFKFALVAGELNSWKPDPKIFHHALQRLETSPKQTLYVGDNYYADIIGTRQAGLHPVLIDPDGIFPEANCPVIRKMGELKNVLTGILKHDN